METPILSVSGVSKHFGGLMVFSDISFDVLANKALGLMGPNGAGKSTLLNIISGKYKADSGTIRFKGHDITGLSPHRICHLGIGRTYQIPQPFINLTVQENIAVAAAYGRRIGRGAAESEATKIMDVVGLLEKKDVFARDLAAAHRHTSANRQYRTDSPLARLGAPGAATRGLRPHDTPTPQAAQ